jgi:CheY-like chemotaxis protein
MSQVKNVFREILLIDDNRIDAILSSKIINNEQIAAKVLVYHKAQEALNYLQGLQGEWPDAVFLDVMMPEMNGVQFLDQFASLPLPHKITVVLLSGSVLTQEQKTSFEQLYQPLCYLHKPVHKENLLQALSTLPI